jgi:Carboxypeptidase regulatory-like domain/TonB dependent receptor/TonB-dependent Receptor Plug Domain
MESLFMNRSLFRSALVAILALALGVIGTNAYAQGGVTQPLAGTVVDASGAVIPGADVSAKHNGTGVVTTAVTNGDGVFSMAAMPVGTYTVTVTLQGFKTVVISNVVITSGAGANVKATMEVGGVTEQVTVASSSEIVQTQTAGVAQTVNATQIVKLPLTSRGAMDFVNLLPGVTTPNGNRQASINGLPRSAINITLDGVNIQDNTLKGVGDDGFFAIVNPRLDAVEEVTVSTAAQGTDATADGAAQIKFVTRSGSNTFSGSGYEYFRSDKLNANTWFNNAKGIAKVPLKQNQTGFRAGGPIIIPGWFDGHNKAFFFVNYEEFHAPSAQTRTRTVLSPAAQAGNYCYGSTCVNVLALGAASSTIDPTVAKLLADINAATQKTGTLTANGNPNQLNYNFNFPVASLRRYPTGKVDYNITQKHRLSSALNYQYFYDSPDTLNRHEPAFPGFPFTASQTSKRMAFSNSLRSTLTGNMVNEATAAYAWAPVSFFPEETAGMFTGSVANTNGFAFQMPSVDSNITLQGAPSSNGGNTNPSPQSRNATTLDITDNLTWLKGAHSLTIGGQVSSYHVWLKNSTAVPTLSFAVATNDPATALFSAANFPGASASQLTAAQTLFAFLTGRVGTIGADARLDSSGQYVYEGVGKQEGSLQETAAFIQDQWRVRPNLTINGGVRYDLQFPFKAANSIYTFGDLTNICGVSGAANSSSCNLFQPGNMPGQKPVFQQYKAGVGSFNTDYNNFGPSVGVAWTPQGRPGILGKVMGPNDFVIRAGYSRSFSRPGVGDYTGIFGSNPGVRLTNSLSGPQILSNAGQSGVLLLTNPLVQQPLPFPSSPTYPLQPTSFTNSINGFNPNIQIPYSDSWQIGITRSVGKDMALEARYVGTHGYKVWNDYNYNEVNINTNGFLNEFRTAQGNLAANIAAGKGNTFAFTGAPGTNPLPTFLGYFQGLSAANAGNPANYTSTNFSNATFLGFLAAQNPNPFGFLSLSSTSTTSFITTSGFRTNGLAAGIPANFFIANPDLTGGAFVRDNRDSSYYDGLQLEFRRRYSKGLQFQVSYSFDHAYSNTFLGFINGNTYRRTTGTEGDLTHQYKSLVTYDLPFGQGRRWGGSASGVLERVIGGWQASVSSVLHSGQLVDFGNVRLVGMTPDDVRKMIKVRFDTSGAGLVYMLPADVVQNTINAFSVSATSASGYSGAAPTGRYFAPANGPNCIETENSSVGKCGVGSLIVAGPLFQQHDISVAKRTKVVGHTNAEFRVEMLNAFNHPNFTPVSGIGGTQLSNYQLTGLSGTNTSRVVQLVFRFNW